jgi:MFS family permease
MADSADTVWNSRVDIRFNTTVNLLDGAFFGLALGFASFITVIPLFVSQLTDSPILIGLVPAIHSVGWQLPQSFTAGRVRRLSRYKPMVLAMTLQERLPFVGLMILAWTLPGINRNFALVLVFTLLIWQGLGGGWTATVWQSLIGKIIPVTWRGSFFGAQAAAANLMASISAVAAGQILERFPSPLNFTLCFAFAGAAMAISFAFLAATKEEEHTPAKSSESSTPEWQDIKRILREDGVFKRFVLVRMIFQVGMVAFAFYAVYVVGELGMSAGLVGWLTGVLIFGEVIVNPLIGILGDRKGHQRVLVLGALAAVASTALAGWVISVEAWFLTFALAGVGYAVGWTTTMVLSLEFGLPEEQATYIGLSNTLIAPATLAAPFIAGSVIQGFGYPVLFHAASITFVCAALLSISMVRMAETESPAVGRQDGG